MIRVTLRPLDFTALRDVIRPIDVLLRRGWSPRYHCGDVYRGECPIHRSTSRSSRVFSCQSRVWYCHKCRRGGDAVRLYAILEGVSDLAAAHALCERFAIPKPYLH